MPRCASSLLVLVLYIWSLSIYAASQAAPPSLASQKPAPAAQSTAAPASPVPASPAVPDSAQESVVIEQSVMKVAFEADGTGTREQSVAVRVQSQAGVQALGVLSFAYLSSNENVEFDYIRVRKPDGTVVNTPDYNVQDMPAEVTRIAPMYSDIHEKHVTVKALGVGDVLEYRIRYRTFKPQVQGQFWWEYTFDNNYISHDTEVELTVPKDKYLNLASPKYKPESKDDGSHRTYAWKTSNLKRKDPDERVSRDSLKPDIQLSTFRSWQELGSWYNDLQRTQMQVTPQIQAKVTELTKGLTSDEDKTRAIYDYVSTRFHYVSLSFGVGRYQPHPAEDVLENEYGDCKDKHTLLATMLKAAGIEAWPALMNGERKVDPAMPSPGQFNHVITYVPQSGKPLWLDTTPGVAPFDMLMANLRDKQALVIPSDKPAELKTTPANPPFPAGQTFTMEGAIDKDGTLKAHVKQTLRGDYEVIARIAFRTTAQPQWKDLVQRIANAQGFGGEVSNATASTPDDTSKPFELSYDYTRKNYSDWDNHRMIAPLPFTGLEGASAQEKKPADPVDLGALGDVVLTAKITLPMDVEKLQSDISVKEPYAEYQSTYSHSGNVLTSTRRLKIKQNEVPLASWDNYKKFSKKLSDDWSSYTELYAAVGDSNQTSESPDAASTSKAPPEVVKKAQEAYSALRRNDTSTAEHIFQELLKAYPDQQGLHGALAQVYAQRNDTEHTLKELNKEKELHPDNIGVYPILARYYLYVHRDDDAAEQYRVWIQQDPKSYEAYSGLSAILANQKKYAKNIELWESASKQLPDDTRVKSNLGYAYVYEKQPDKGIPLIEQGLNSETEPIEFNNAAWALADENVQLAKAKQWGDEALRRLTQQSLSADSEDTALTTTKYLGLTWDTVGWIYFRMGDYETALRYLRAAFLLSQDALEGYHLAQVYERKGKKEEAEHTYKLAYAQAKAPLKREIKEQYQSLMGKDADPEDSPIYLKRGAASKDFGAEDELSRVRTTKISSKATPAGSATFTIVFSPGKIEDVKFVSGDEKLKAMATQVASSNLRADFPDSGPARLTRRGVLVCEATGCDFTLLLPNAPYTTESQQ